MIPVIKPYESLEENKTNIKYGCLLVLELLMVFIFSFLLYSHFLNFLYVITYLKNKNKWIPGFPGGAVVKNPPANAGDTGSSPGPGRSHMPRSN